MNMENIEHRKAILDLTIEELEAYLKSLGAPAFRTKQVFGWLYREMVTDFQQMTNVPKALRDQLDKAAFIQLLEPAAESISDEGLTRKVLFRLHDGAAMEAVLMLYPQRQDARARRTICISSQAGCGMACAFCATGKGGLVRNLTSGEIASQVLHFARQLAKEGDAITNVVVMGQGEPLANLDAVWKAIGTLNSPYGFGLGARHFTISTVGIVPKIRQLAQRGLQVGLAVSLHAPNDALRSRLLPINEKFPLAELMTACRDYTRMTSRRITFEYALIDGVNDGIECVRELAALLKGMLCHVNLILLNTVADLPYRPSPQGRAAAFQAELVRLGIPTTTRLRRGSHIDAACGQLRARHLGDA